MSADMIVTSPNNYGDVALNLPPDWSRSRVGTHDGFIMTTVGHENGIPDIYLKKDMSIQHQFNWVAPEDQNRVSVLRTKHFVFCTKSEWGKNEMLWMWDAEGHLVHNGQHAMARDRVWYDQEKEEEKRREEATQGKRAISQEEESAMRRLESLTARPEGAIMTDDRGRSMKPLAARK